MTCFAVAQIIAHYQVSSEMDAISDLSEYAVKASNPVHELQKERGMNASSSEELAATAEENCSLAGQSTPSTTSGDAPPIFLHGRLLYLRRQWETIIQ